MKIAILMPFTWTARCSSSLLSAVNGVDIEFPPLAISDVYLGLQESGTPKRNWANGSSSPREQKEHSGTNRNYDQHRHKEGGISSPPPTCKSVGLLVVLLGHGAIRFRAFPDAGQTRGGVVL